MRLKVINLMAIGVILLSSCASVANTETDVIETVIATETTTEMVVETITGNVPTETTTTTIPTATTTKITPINETSITTTSTTTTTTMITTTKSTPNPDIPIKIDFYEEINEYGAGSIDGTKWFAQIFTAQIDYVLTSVNLYGWCTGSPNTVSVRIRAINGNIPMGNDLAVGVADAKLWGIGESARDWYEVAFLQSFRLNKNTQYALISSAEGDINSNFNWVYINSGKYEGGNASISTNGGKTFGDGGTFERDFAFQIFGKPVGVS